MSSTACTADSVVIDNAVTFVCVCLYLSVLTDSFSAPVRLRPRFSLLHRRTSRRALCCFSCFRAGLWQTVDRRLRRLRPTLTTHGPSASLRSSPSPTCRAPLLKVQWAESSVCVCVCARVCARAPCIAILVGTMFLKIVILGRHLILLGTYYRIPIK